MNIILEKLQQLTVCAVMVFATFFALPAGADAYLKPYVGLDAQKRSMFFEQGFGRNLFKHRYRQTNVYVGLQFNQFFGLEFGYQNSIKRESQVALEEGDHDIGTTVGIADNYTILVKNKLKGPHADFVFFLPVSEHFHLDLITIVGISKLTLTLSKDILVDNGIPNTDLATDHRDFKQTRWIPRVNIGAQQKITDAFSVRFLVGWERTKKFNNVRPVQQSPLVAKARNSINYSMGIIYHF